MGRRDKGKSNQVGIIGHGDAEARRRELLTAYWLPLIANEELSGFCRKKAQKTQNRSTNFLTANGH